MEKVAAHVKGNTLFKSGDLEGAVAAYREAVSEYAKLGGGDPEKLAGSVQSNVALCLLQLEQYEEVITTCNECLRLDWKNVKAYHRRGQAQEALGRPELAWQDMRSVLKKVPDDAATCEAVDRLVRGFKFEPLGDYSFSDDNGKVKVYIDVPGLATQDDPDAHVAVDFGRKTLDLVAVDVAGLHHRMHAPGDLWGDIDVEKCSYKLKAGKDRVTITLVKKPGGSMSDRDWESVRRL